MAAGRIVQNDFPRSGQSQAERTPPALDPAHAPVDGRTAAERVGEIRRLAALLRFHADDPERASGHWDAFFPADAEARVQADDGNTPPHLGLLGAFLDMLAPAQDALNRLGERHLDFHYHRVLGFTPRPAQPEHVHLCVEAKKGSAAFAVTPAMVFAAGKDARGAERRYAPVRETVIGHGRLAALCSVHRDDAGLRFAPIANSSDGFGAALDSARPSWPAFGEAGHPHAPLGFAFASSLLRMSEGVRSIRLGLELAFLDASGLTAAQIASSLDACVSGPQGWLGPYAVSGSKAGGLVVLTFTVPADDPQVVDCDPALHGAAFATTLPVVQFVLRPGAAAHPGALAGLRLDRAQLAVRVRGKRDLELENDFGSLNPKRSFQPFGAQPRAGARFLIGCSEALAKPLSSLSIALGWQGAPASLRDWYAGYGRVDRIADGVRASLVYQDGAGTRTRSEQTLVPRIDGVTTLSPTAPRAPGKLARERRLGRLAALRTGDVSPRIGARSPDPRHRLFDPSSVITRALPGGAVSAAQAAQAAPIASIASAARAAAVPPPAVRSGFVTVALIDDFLHADYRREILENALAGSTTVLNEPYTPVVQEISLSYSAALPLIDLRRADADAFLAAADLQFFHVGAFGARREHPFLRRDLAWVADKQPGLLPAYADEGEFLVAIDGIGAGESIHLLLQVAEGSANPDLPAQAIAWSVLCDNHWRPVAADELILDTTRNLRASGLVGIVLARPTRTDNSWLPAGPVWLKAGIAGDRGAACRLLGVHANAIEAVRQWPQEHTPDIETLPAGTVTRLLAPPSGFRKVTQPYASFGGRAGETPAMLRRRAAERLRHRQRCITAWDYERLLLEAFPEVHRIKCIPHAGERSWNAPGHVLIVAVPDLNRHGGAAVLQPKVDLDTLTRMRELAQAHAPAGVRVHVRNPDYLAVRLDFRVRFRPGLPFEHSRRELHAALLAALSPWAFGSGRQLDFGGTLYRSVLLDFVEELPCVDYVRDFRFGPLGPDGLLLADVAEVTAPRPDVIVVSADQHRIGEA